VCKEIKSVQSFSSGTYIALVLNATVGLATTMTPGIAKDGERKSLKLLAINRGVDTKENEVEKEAADLASGYHRQPNGTRNCSNGHLARPNPDCQREPRVCEMARSIYLLCPQGQAASGRNMSGNVVKLFQDHGPDFCEPNIRPDNYQQHWRVRWKPKV